MFSFHTGSNTSLSLYNTIINDDGDGDDDNNDNVDNDYDDDWNQSNCKHY